ncbi:hypothetical protein ACQUSR_16660 [Streptomyces sp. P1-3]|uniref:hypothetical protein n=1 Tax=Streptomyces sp. P1-3 TaxID=3421658 RepID=UPI003D36ED71
MSQNDDLKVTPAVLRAAAAAADTISNDLTSKIKTAVDDSVTVTESLSGWAVTKQLDTTTESWRLGLKTIRERLEATATALRGTISDHEWNEKEIALKFPAGHDKR